MSREKKMEVVTFVALVITFGLATAIAVEAAIVFALAILKLFRNDRRIR